MEKVDTQLALIIQDIKSPTFDAMRASIIADGIGNIIAGLIFLLLMVFILIKGRSINEDSKNILWFKGPFDREEINMMRLISGLFVFIFLIFSSLNILSPSNWMKVFYPDAKIAERVLYHR